MRRREVIALLGDATLRATRPKAYARVALIMLKSPPRISLTKNGRVQLPQCR